jgi:hypothetical protein
VSDGRTVCCPNAMRPFRRDDSVPLMHATDNPLRLHPSRLTLALTSSSGRRHHSSPGVMAVVDATEAVAAAAAAAAAGPHTPRRRHAWESVGVQRGSPVAWSPDGAVAAIAGGGYEVRLLHLLACPPGGAEAAPAPLRFELAMVLSGLGAPVLRIEFLGGGGPPLVAAASCAGAVVWDTRGGGEVWRQVRARLSAGARECVYSCVFMRFACVFLWWA